MFVINFRSETLKSSLFPPLDDWPINFLHFHANEVDFLSSNTAEQRGLVWAMKCSSSSTVQFVQFQWMNKGALQTYSTQLPPFFYGMVQDSINDHIFDRPQFFLISSYRVVSNINGKLFSFSIGWWHSFDCIRAWIQINPNKKLIGLQRNGHAVLSNQRCHDVTVSTVFQRNSKELASARTPKRTSSLTTDVQISKKGALVIVYVYWQECIRTRVCNAWSLHHGALARRNFK